ncbi:MAG: DUF3489 domain-containing protein [Parvularculaceae bacterium]
MAKQTTSKKKRAAPTKSKTDTILGLLRRKNGATIDELGKATEWQEHSVRGFLSGTVKKKLELTLTNEKFESGVQRYYLKNAW